MAGILGRSRSLRLKASQNEFHSQDSGKSTPTPPSAKSQIDLGKLKDATSATKVDRRVETPDLLQRPKTSGGPGDRGRLFHKKVAPVVLSSDNRTTFNFPIPSPQATVIYAAKVHEDGGIGMALGSPTMASPWNQNSHATDYATGQTGTITQISYDNSIADSSDTNQEAARPKISRWKSLFGKKTTNASHTPFYQLQQFPVQKPRAEKHIDTDSLDSYSVFKPDSRINSPMPSATEQKDTRKRSKSIKKPTSEKERVRAAMEKMASNYKPSLREEGSPPPPPKDSWNHSPSIPKLTVSNDYENNSPRTIGGGLLLDVDIPNIQMERYSVMFGSLLKPDRSSSLFVRRQGNSEKLKPLTELSMKRDDANSRNGLLKPVRRATSPSLTKSPTFSLSLFPKPGGAREDKTTSPRISAVHRPRPLHRSNTAPALSPSRHTFAKPNGVEKKLTHVEIIPEDPPSDPGRVTQLLTPTPTSRHSFDSEEVPLVIANEQSRWKPRLQEPEWEIVSKHAGLKSQEYKPSLVPIVAELDAQGDIKPKPLLRRDSPQATDVDSQNATQVSVGVARTVSLSRAAGPSRHDMLKPLVSDGSIEKLVDRKPLTPTLVELKNRKSQRVQLVDF